MRSLYPTDVVAEQKKRREEEKKKKNRSIFFVLSMDVGRRERISARYTLLHIYMFFVVVGTAADLIGSSR